MLNAVSIFFGSLTHHPQSFSDSWGNLWTVFCSSAITKLFDRTGLGGRTREGGVSYFRMRVEQRACLNWNYAMPFICLVVARVELGIRVITVQYMAVSAGTLLNMFYSSTVSLSIAVKIFLLGVVLGLLELGISEIKQHLQEAELSKPVSPTSKALVSRLSTASFFFLGECIKLHMFDWHRYHLTEQLLTHRLCC